MKNFCITPTSSLRELSKRVAQYLQQHERMETSRYLTPEGEYIVHGQVRDGKLRRLIGMDKRVVVRMCPKEDGCVEVVLDAPAWKDKASTGLASTLVLWPLMLTALYGVWDQYALFRRLRELLQANH